MYISRLEVKNFMSHKDTKLDLYPITVLVGANGGGKSALFDALLNFSMVSRGPIPHAFGPGPYSFPFVRYRGASQTSRIGYVATFAESFGGEETLTYEISYGAQGDSYTIHRELITSGGATLFDREEADRFQVGGAAKYLAHDRGILAAIRQARVRGDYVDEVPLLTSVAQGVSRISKYRLEPSNLARPSRLPEDGSDGEADTPRLSYEGEDLPSVLYHLSETEDPSMSVIQEECARAIPGFTRFEFNTVGVNKVGFSAVFADARGVVPAANLSDGTLNFVGLMALLTSADRNPIVCLEEPENGLTPRVLRALHAIMERAADGSLTGTPLQLLISSHSPYTVCEAWEGGAPEFLYQMRSDAGFTVIHPFSDIVAHHQIQLEKDSSGKRTRLNLSNAENIMEGYLDSMPGG